uniref:Uncharacterized protein n=1 Tax=Anopheles quadriannulatus TaxID=34691 RepID=A0A182XT18_ANOQN
MHWFVRMNYTTIVGRNKKQPKMN